MKTVNPKAGQTVWLNQVPHEILKVNGQEFHLKIKGDENAPIVQVALRAAMAAGDLLFKSPFEESSLPIWDLLADDKQESARLIYDSIKPYFEGISSGMTKGAAAKRAAEEAGVSEKTIRDRVKNYNQSGMAGLAPSGKKGGVGVGRINGRVEAVISECINKFYLMRPGVSVSALINKKIYPICEANSLSKPSRKTVQKRIDAIPEAIVHSARKGKKSAKSKFHVSRASFPGADFPLAVVQFDHTPLDVMVVDKELRRSIGRPYLTLAIDVYSRMVYGYFLSLQPPSYVSTAMCLLAGIKPKDALLNRFGLEADDWPVCGLPACIHVDNGKDFRSKHLADFCQEYQINLEYRPIRTPQYGGHVERLFRTINKQLHQIKGTTYSSVYKKGDYQSEKEACLSLDDLEEFLALTILEYHLEIHSGIRIPPKLCWDKAFTSGLIDPHIPTDLDRMIIDILPLNLKTIQKDGVAMFSFHYTSDVLQSIRNQELPNQKRQKYKIKYDPRDISRLYLLNPYLNRYETLHLTDRRIGKMSLIELDMFKAVLKQDKKAFNVKNLGLYQHRKEEVLERAMELHMKKRYQRQKERIARGKDHSNNNVNPNTEIKPALPEKIDINPMEISLEDLD